MLLFLLFVIQSVLPSQAQASDMVIPNGKRTDRYPVVVELNIVPTAGKSHTCTATLIGKGTLLSAGHCVKNKEGEAAIKRISFQWDKKEIVVDGWNTPEGFIPGGSHMEEDLAILRFDSSKIVSPPRYPVISASSPAKLQKVILVGFGDNAPGKGAGFKRYGTALVSSNEGETTTLYGYSATPRISFSHPEGKPTGVNVSAASGDSGGPMLDESGQFIYGVCTTGKTLRNKRAHSRARSRHVNISSPRSRAFMKQEREKGADFTFSDDTGSIAKMQTPPTDKNPRLSIQPEDFGEITAVGASGNTGIHGNYAPSLAFSHHYFDIYKGTAQRASLGVGLGSKRVENFGLEISASKSETLGFFIGLTPSLGESVNVDIKNYRKGSDEAYFNRLAVAAGPEFNLGRVPYKDNILTLGANVQGVAKKDKSAGWIQGGPIARLAFEDRLYVTAFAGMTNQNKTGENQFYGQVAADVRFGKLHLGASISQRKVKNLKGPATVNDGKSIKQVKITAGMVL